MDQAIAAGGTGCVCVCVCVGSILSSIVISWVNSFQKRHLFLFFFLSPIVHCIHPIFDPDLENKWRGSLKILFTNLITRIL